MDVKIIDRSTNRPKFMVYDVRNFRSEERLNDGMVKRQLSFDYSIDNEGPEVEYDDIVVFEELNYIVKETLRKNHMISVSAIQDVSDLVGNVIFTYSLKSASVQTFLQYAVSGTRYGFDIRGVDLDDTRSAHMENITSMKALEKICEIFWCEIWIDNNTVHVVDAIGNKESRLRFVKGNNLREIEKKVNTHDFYTRMVPLGANGLTIATENNGSIYLQDTTHSKRITTCVWEDSNYTNAADLKAAAEKKFSEVSSPTTVYSANIVDLFGMMGYEEYKPELGIVAEFSDVDAGMNTRERIVSIIRYPDAPEKNSIELSNRIYTFEDMQKKLLAAAENISSVTNGAKIIVGSKVIGLTVEQIEGLDPGGGEKPEALKTPRAIDGVFFDGSDDIIHFATCTASSAQQLDLTPVNMNSAAYKATETGTKWSVLFRNGVPAGVNKIIRIAGTSAPLIYQNARKIPAIPDGAVIDIEYVGLHHTDPMPGYHIIGQIPEDVQISGFRLYGQLSDIGISGGTAQQVIAAMSEKSIFMTQLTQSGITGLGDMEGYEDGFIRITKAQGYGSSRLIEIFSGTKYKWKDASSANNPWNEQVGSNSFRIYGSLSDIGLTVNNTLQDVYNAMPDKSTLMMPVYGNEIKDMPESSSFRYGFFRITKNTSFLVEMFSGQGEARRYRWRTGTDTTAAWNEVEYPVSSGSSGENYFGTCSTESTAVDKNVAIDGFPYSDIGVGVRVSVLFKYALGVSNPRLNVGNKQYPSGARDIYLGNSKCPLGYWDAGDIVDFVYDGQYWRICDRASASGSGNYFGLCETSYNSTSKEVSIDGIADLHDGLVVTVLFWQGTSQLSNLTLNLNNLGAKQIAYNSSSILPQLPRLATMAYYQDQWHIVGFVHRTVKSSDYTASCQTPASTAAKQIDIPTMDYNYPQSRDTITVVFEKGITTSSITMSLNGGSQRPVSFPQGFPINAAENRTFTFVYNGATWIAAG